MEAEDLLREMRRTVSQLEALTQIGKRLTHNLERGDVLSAIMEQVGQVLHTTNWSLLLLDGDKLRFEIAVGEGADKLRGCAVGLGVGIVGWCAEHGEGVFVADVSKDTRFAPQFDKLSTFATASVLAAPLICRGSLLGVMELVSGPDQPPFAFADLSVLATFADFAAIAIDNAQNYAQIEALTVSDEVTRLHNARHLHTVLPLELARAQRYDKPLSIVFFDLDRFKQVNDTHGHQAGSRLLFEIGELVRGCMRRNDIGVRFGGDEFIVVLPETDSAGGRTFAERLRVKLSETVFLEERGLAVHQTASFGISTFPGDGDNAERLLKVADSAMYRVKESSRDGVRTARE